MIFINAPQFFSKNPQIGTGTTVLNLFFIISCQMRKSISRYLWSTIDTPKCTIDTLKYLQQQSKEDAIKHFETAFKNCKNRKSCNAAKLNQLKAYEILVEQVSKRVLICLV
jgi:hypothetical protein